MGGSSDTNVPPERPRTAIKCPDSVSVASAWRSVEREMHSCSASSRSGGSLAPAPSTPIRIAVPRRVTVSSYVLEASTGSNTVFHDVLTVHERAGTPDIRANHAEVVRWPIGTISYRYGECRERGSVGPQHGATHLARARLREVVGEVDHARVLVRRGDL